MSNGSASDDVSYYAPQPQGVSLAALENWSIAIVVFAAIVVLGLLASTVVIIMKRAKDESKISHRTHVADEERGRETRSELVGHRTNDHRQRDGTQRLVRIQSSSLVVNDGSLDRGSLNRETISSVAGTRTVDGYDGASLGRDDIPSTLLSDDSCLPANLVRDELLAARQRATGLPQPIAAAAPAANDRKGAAAR